jgi:GT2 family glycosyltransferase
VDLSIVILNYNGKHWLEGLLPSLRAQLLSRTALHCETVVVDNASTDGSVEWLQQQADVRLLEAGKNGGFACGNNIALRRITARYVLLLNSDTELVTNRSDWDRLIGYMDAHPEVGILTPRLELSDGSLDKACHRGEPTPWAAFTYLAGMEKRWGKCRPFGRYHLTHLPLNTIHPIEACSGAAMLVRKTAMDEVGLLDERFFMYAEDLDWCRRFRQAGFQVVYHPEVVVLHHKYGSRQLDRNASRYWFYETMLQYYDKHYPTFWWRIPQWFLRLYVRRQQQRLHPVMH